MQNINKNLTLCEYVFDSSCLNEVITKHMNDMRVVYTSYVKCSSCQNNISFNIAAIMLTQCSSHLTLNAVSSAVNSTINSAIRLTISSVVSCESAS